MTGTFDAIIVGAGQAGPSLAGRLTAAGMSVAIVERHLFGGTCVNTGCTPTKTLIASAEIAHKARRAADFGIHIPGDVAVDMKAVKRRKDDVVAQSRDGLESWLRGMERCAVLKGHARFESPHEMRVGSELIGAERIFLNVGARAVVPDLPGIDTVPHLDNTTLLELDTLPRHLVIVGGSYIGLEFAQMYRRFGSEVTVIEKGPGLVWHEDEEISRAIQSVLAAEGIAIRTGAECIRLRREGDAVVAAIECSDGPPEVIGNHLLLAVGRQPNTDDLGLERAGVARDGRGYIAVDEQLRTSVPGIWALGDCNGRGAFTHTAYNDHEIVADNLLGGASRRVGDRIPCYALYVDPPLGRVGMSEREARSTGHSVRVGVRPMTRVMRAVEKGEADGLMKLVVDAGNDRILGAAVLGVGGDEVIHCILDVMSTKAPYTLLQHTMHIHPTVSELVPTVLGTLRP